MRAKINNKYNITIHNIILIHTVRWSKTSRKAAWLLLQMGYAFEDIERQPKTKREQAVIDEIARRVSKYDN